MEKLSFFTPVSYDDLHHKTFPQRIFEKVDSYFYLGKRRACVISPRLVNGRYQVEIRETKTSLVATALKIASYILIIIPLLMLVGKLMFRASNSFEIAGKQVKAPDKRVALTDAEKKTAEKAFLQIGYILSQKLANTKSLCFSPASMAPVLGMLFGGLEPTDRPAFMKRLGFEGWTEDKVHAAFSHSLNNLKVKGNQAEIAVANGILNTKI